MNDTTDLSLCETKSAIACRLLRTGHADGCAHFYPGLYQLALVRGEQEDKIDLGYSGSRLLERLLQTPGEVVSREELMSYAWADRVVGQGSLNQQIYTLRQVLGDEKDRQIIQTLPRRGYLLNPSFLIQPEPTPEPEPEEGPIQAPSNPSFLRRHARRRKSWIILLSSLGALLLSLFAWLLHLSQPPESHTLTEDKGHLHMQYLTQTADSLQPLVMQTHTLINRLALLTHSQTEATLSLRGGFYVLTCLHQSGQGRTLSFSQNQLARISDAQLAECLP